MNKVSLIGRLTKDPILRTMSDDRKVSGFILAVPNGYKKDEADFITCSIYGKLAELTVKYCGKGSLVGITGRIHTRSYEKEPSNRVYATDVIVEEIRFLATKRKEEHPPDQVEVSEERFEFPQDLKPNTLPV